MREVIARLICIFTVVVVLALAHVFAARHNPVKADTKPLPSSGAASAPIPAPAIERGRQVYAEQGCSSCHAIAGVGNPRNPLDGVGGRRNHAELIEWVTGAGSTVDQLAPAVLRRKQRYRDLPQESMNDLVAYLGSLVRKT
jgi:mono/diheme cytochrome c family protein